MMDETKRILPVNLACYTVMLAWLFYKSLMGTLKKTKHKLKQLKLRIYRRRIHLVRN